MAAAGLLGALRNNTNASWWKDPGLIKLNAIIFGIFLLSVTNGYDNSLINNLQSLDTFLSDFGYPSASVLGIMNAFSTVGALLGNVPASFVGDRWGRKNGILFGGIVAIIGTLLQAFAYNTIQYIVGRVVMGISINIITINGSIMVNEIAHPRYRGHVGGFYNVIWYVGAIMAAWICYGTRLHLTGTWQWRLPSLFQLGPALWTIGLRFWLPESPRWLISKGRIEEGKAFLYKYHANGDTSDEMVTAEIEEIVRTMELEATVQAGTTWKKAFEGKANRKRMMVAAMFGTSIILNSQGIISYYNSAIYKQAGITSSFQQLTLNGGLTIVDLFAAFGGAVLSGYIGRKKMLYIGFGGMLIAHIVVTGLASTYANTKQSGIGYGIIAFIWLESVMYNVGLNPMTYLYPAEIMSFALRTKGMAFFLIFADIWGIATKYANPVGLANLGWKYYIIFCFFYVGSLLSVYYFYPETKGKTLEEIEVLMDGQDVDFAREVNELPDVENVEFVPGGEKGSGIEEKN